MTRKKRGAKPALPDIFAVECPACRMALAATGELAGSPARCPLCHADFCVPHPSAAEDTGEPAAAPAREPAPVTASPASPSPASPSPASPSPASPSPASGEPAPASRAAAAPGPAAVLAAPPAPAGQTPVPLSFPADVFEAAVAPPSAPDPELAFHEPVRTIGSGEDAIELRRLSPEEKRLRRARRNAVMLLAGALVLIVITLVLGRGTRR